MGRERSSEGDYEQVRCNRHPLRGSPRRHETMLMKELLAIPPKKWKHEELKNSLDTALKLEFTTIPPYLCALWSIMDRGTAHHRQINRIVQQEMGHMGLVCNLLTTIDECPQISAPGAIPEYPSFLPGLDLAPEVYLA